jgi:hypothetical protein
MAPAVSCFAGNRQTVNESGAKKLFNFTGWTTAVPRRSHNVAMKLNEQFFNRQNQRPSGKNPFRFFKVSCWRCGSLRVILVAKLNYENGEIAVVQRIPSRKSHCCEPPKNGSRCDAMDTGDVDG